MKELSECLLYVTVKCSDKMKSFWYKVMWRNIKIREARSKSLVWIYVFQVRVVDIRVLYKAGNLLDRLSCFHFLH